MGEDSDKEIEEALEKGIQVSLGQTPSTPSNDQILWAAIRNRSQATAFRQYSAFIDTLFGGSSSNDGPKERLGEIRQDIITHKRKPNPDEKEFEKIGLTIHAAGAYGILRAATEAFLLLECGVVFDQIGIDDKTMIFDPEQEGSRKIADITFDGVEGKLGKYLTQGQLPYLAPILAALLGTANTSQLHYYNKALQYRDSHPSMLELIWSYWHEEAMLVQTMNAVTLRFQNRRGPAETDPLANLELDPLRPLNNLLWGYIQNEQNRLTVPRRAYEYDHHYGLTLYGKAVPQLRSADSRSKFLQGFHALLNQTAKFYRQDANTTVVADGFPLLNALKEVHASLAEGMHNQFGDLPWTARVEMLIEQWLLARPEIHDFLRGRYMVPYNEPWMGAVDTMKKLQAWGDTSVTHFNELAAFGEQILLSIRWGDWGDLNATEDQAKNWARYWKPEIQGYIHSYRAVTGVDLTTEPVDSTPPWVHLKRQEDARRAKGRG